MAHALTQRIWDRLPELWRDADEQLSYQLLNLLDDILLHDGGPAWDTIIKCMTGDYVGPLTADWVALPWLAELLGVELLDGDPLPRRLQFADPAQRMTGSAPAITRYVRALVGASIQIDLAPRWRGNRWLSVILTDDVTTPVSGTPIVTWGQLMATAPTLADLIEEGTIADTMAIDMMRYLIATSAERQRPAGIRFAHRLAAIADMVLNLFEIDFWNPPGTALITPGNLSWAAP